MSEEVEYPDEVKHYGIIRKSGRYPWGSGENPYQRSLQFQKMVKDLKEAGLTPTEIAKVFSEYGDDPDTRYNTTSLRATTSQAKDEVRAAERAEAIRLKFDRQMSNTAIAAKMGKPESSVRALLKDSVEERVNLTKNTMSILEEHLNNGNYLDIGAGIEANLGIPRNRVDLAVALLKDQGYEVFYDKVLQRGTGKETSLKVLVPPGVDYKEYKANRDERLKTIGMQDDLGKKETKPGLRPIINTKSKELQIRFAEEGGSDMDGIIELRPGVKDLDLGKARYAQVRIGVDGTHYLKGVAVYADDLPDGVNIRFNTNKTREEAPGISSLKEMKSDDPKNPFESEISRQRGALNIINEEGEWGEWKHNFSSQMLSKQKPVLAKQQLGLAREVRKSELEDIMSLTNPTVKKELLTKFADGADAAAVDLSAMGLPRTRNHVLLPVPSLKPNEIYAPNYKDGERVVLIRHPHGGIFEIPELVVNNRSRKAKEMMGRALDAVGINPIVAEQLSGADFDGDTVLVIPQKTGNSAVKVSKRLKDLEDFNPRDQYKGFPGMKVMSNTQMEMGMISNLITDMTIKEAEEHEIAAAVRHSMVVIDAEKHKLNYRQSAIDNNIAGLKKKYQSNPDGSGGASTLISRVGSPTRIEKRRLARVAEGGPIDTKTGAQRFVRNERESYVNKDGETVYRTETVDKGRLVDDLYDLASSPITVMEKVYADHGNELKALANQARLAAYKTEDRPRSKTAAAVYKQEVDQLNANLRLAQSNAPLERKAQIVAGTIVQAKIDANPNLDKDAIKKLNGRALTEARAIVGASKSQIEITPRQWEAIQAGAISPTKLRAIIDNSDLDVLKEMAMPRAKTTLNSSKLARIKAMAKNDYTQEEIAEALGVSVSTVLEALR